MSCRILFTLPLLLFSVLPATLNAQAKFAIYGTVGAEKTGISVEPWTLAETFGLYYGLLHPGPIAISVDGRGDLSRNINSALFGPRVALDLPYFPIKPYVEVVGGVSNYNTQDSGPRNITSSNYRWVGGIDTTVLPHLDWRIDYSFGGAGITQASHPQSLTSGLVVRF